MILQLYEITPTSYVFCKDVQDNALQWSGFSKDKENNIITSNILTRALNDVFEGAVKKYKNRHSMSACVYLLLIARDSEQHKIPERERTDIIMW